MLKSGLDGLNRRPLSDGVTRTAGLRVDDTSHEEDAAAGVLSDDVQERTVDVDLDNRSLTTTTSSVAHADGRGTACLGALHVHLDDRHVLDESDVQVTGAKTRQISRRVGEDVVHSHAL